MLHKLRDYKVYEYTSNRLGAVVISAHIMKEEERYKLNIELRTEDDNGIQHFVVGYFVEVFTEETVEKEVTRLLENGYFDDFIKYAKEEEELLENYNNLE